MPEFCLRPELTAKLKDAAKAGQISIEKLATMSSEERRVLFGKFIDAESAKGVNAGFENAWTKESATAMKTWVEKTFSSAEKKKPAYNDIINKINNLNKQGILSPESETAFMEDLVREKLGASISVEEASKIAEKANTLEQTYSKVTGLGDPYSDHRSQEAYLKARRDMENYVDSLTPSSNLRVAQSTISRGNMLFRAGSILVNINSNNLQGALESVVRRFETRRLGGLNNKAVSDTVKWQTHLFKAYGYDLSRMTSLESDRKILGESYNNVAGKGIIRKTGQVYQDFLFNMTQGLPDVFASSLAGADRANLMSTRMVAEKGLKGAEAKTKALDIYRDSMRVEPLTDEGKLVKANAVADALRSTNQDKRIFADRALKFRNLLNHDDLRFGDISIPFVKTTANAIQSSLEASGITVAPSAIIRTIKMVKMVAGHEGSLGEVSKEAFSGFGSTLVRAGLGTTGAFLVANAIDSKNYIGVYPTTSKEQELLRLRKASANSINVGGKWISLDWFGPLAAPLVGFMSAKKYGKNFQDGLVNYVQGAGYTATRTPGFDFVNQTAKYITSLVPGTKQTASARITDAANYAVQYITSRAIPGFVGEGAQATDTVTRETSAKGDVTAPFKAAIPGLRETLPAKLSVFGETTPSEGWKVLILGGRLKQGKTDHVIDELTRLNDAGSLPGIAPVNDRRDGLSSFTRLKSQVGEQQYTKAVIDFGKSFHSGISDLMSTPEYKDATDPEKQLQINNLKKKTATQVLDDYGYIKPEKKAK